MSGQRVLDGGTTLEAPAAAGAPVVLHALPGATHAFEG